MANPGVGNRFVSVNLNKSYGQSSHGSNQSHSGGNYGSNRARSGLGGGGGGGGSGSMVVLSRPRSAHKVGPKLSVPPPLNLPSLRKEHEKFDSLGSGGGSAGGAAAGSGGARPSSSGMGWSKPSVAVTAERDSGGGDRPVSSGGVEPTVDGVNRGGMSTTYMPPSVRSGTTAGPDVSVPMSVEKATVLRGEDFPSLRATLTAANGSTQKPKDSAHQKQRQGISDDPTGGQREDSQTHTSSHFDMRPQVQSSQNSVGNGTGNGSDNNNHNSVHFRSLEQGRKQDDYFPGPLPLVRLSPRSDWADDERDTSHGLTERGRDHGFSRIEAYWDRDFDIPRSSFLPHKPSQSQNQFDRWGQRDDDVGKGLSNEVSNADPFSRDTRAPSGDGREGQTWRTPVLRDGFASTEVLSDRNSMGSRPTSVNRETNKDSKYFPPQFGGNTRDEQNGGLTANRDFAAGTKDPGYVQGGRQQWNNNSADFNRGRVAERNSGDRYGSESNRYKADAVHNNMGPRSMYSAGNKGLSGSDYLPNFGRDKHSFSRSEKPFVEDPFTKDWGSIGFDGGDPFTGGILGVVKRKKDANKQLDFHDPVRESFEAELERVQKIQEQQRQRIVEEQERAIEMARREEEERQRIVREQEERQRRLEEEAREAAWRAEQERLEAIRKAEEQRLAREEEKQRILMEEERRKQAAKQKLLELEEKMARRQAEAVKADSSAAIPGDIMPGAVKERDVSRADDFTGWEDGERMVERITNSASSDSSHSRPFDMGSRAVSVREGSFPFTDRGKPFNSWRRDVFDNGNSSFFSADHENGHQSPRREASVGGRSFSRKDFYGGAGYMPTRGYYRGGIPEANMDDFPHVGGHRWNIPGDGDPYGRNTELEAEFNENAADKFEVGWGSNGGRGNSPFPDRFYQNSELDELYTFGRSRYPVRQPRVLPPPSLPSVHRTSFRNESERAASSAYEDGNIQFNHALRNEPASVSYQNVHEEHADVLDVQEQSAKDEEQELNRSTTHGCDSQSSLSVSSPPSSPTHLSHDDLDETRDSLAVPSTAEGQDISLSDNEAALLNVKAAKDSTVTAESSMSVGDDEEWTVENNGLQEQEEYDEDVGYHEEDEVHEGDDEHAELSQEFEDMHLEGKGSPDMMENLVLGFDQGVEVGLPNDEYERSPRIDGSFYAGSQASVGLMEQKEPFDGSRDGQTPQVADVPQHVSTDSSSMTVQETEKVVQDLVSEPINASHTPPLLEPSVPGDPSSGSVLPPQQLVPLSVGANSEPSSQALLSNVAGVHGPTELPVKLQFGLFSGPSLIPSPVPAIQIGSIQMPLQLHPQIGPPLTHMHASQPPLFQFGQLRYPSPISQGILPLAPQSMSFVQPSVPSSYPSSQRLGGSLPIQAVHDSSCPSSVKDDALSHTVNSQQSQLPNQLNVCQDTESREANFVAGQSTGSNVLSHRNQPDAASTSVLQVRSESGRQSENMGRSYNATRNSKPLLSNRPSESQSYGGPSSSHSASSGPQVPGNRGRRFAFTARNAGGRLSSSANVASRSDSNGFQRRPRHGTQRYEFRVRRTADGKQSSAVLSSNYSGSDAKATYDGRGPGTQTKSGLKKEIPSDKPKQTLDSEVLSSDQTATQGTGSETEEGKPGGYESSTIGLDTSRCVEGSLKRNISLEEDVDAPLQSGVVRVFKQPGIEAPSDEDDFIEVRSKRQMLNDRREQREKEIKAKSTNMRKAQRKSRPAPQGTTANARTTVRTSASSSIQATKAVRTAVTSKRGLANNEVSATFNNVVSQPLPPIGTPPVIADCQADAKTQTSRSQHTSSYIASGQTVASDLTFDAKSKVLDSVQSSLGSWGNAHINQPVMALTQTQLEEAMKPIQFDTHMVSVGDHTSSSVSETGMTSASAVTKDNPFSSATSPISSLLAGEKIQFGAVTSPTILPPSTRVVSHGIRPPASSQLEMQISRTLPSSENNCALLFEKEKHPNKTCLPLEDSEAEAEAAASAVAVAAIGNDEGVGNGVGSCSAAMSVPRSFGGTDIVGLTSGVPGDQQAVNQSKAEEALSVSLPADLSVETPPISLWPPLPSPVHSSSSQMLSPFPGGPTSHFPFYDMNPMMGGPVFAFGPHDESNGLQSQPQKSNVPSSGPLGTWQHHSGVDSFYGPPAGFTAPFISPPPGSIPAGVQGPPHMVVYNHFAPVGQFGQVGLSYMGTTYIPSGKQPDWKRNPTSSAMGGGEGDMKNLNMVPVQRSASNVPAQVQHLAPGSPLLSMAASPMAMFEVSPFQSSPDVSVHPRWSHVQAPALHSIPQSMLPHQAEGAMPGQFSHGSNPTDHHPLAAPNGFPKPQTSSSLEDSRSFAVGANPGGTQFPDELGLVDPPPSAGSEGSGINVGSKNRPGNAVPEGSGRVVDAVPEGSGTKRNPQAAITAPHKTQSAHQRNPSGQQQYNHHHYQRGGTQKTGSGAEWSNRKMGFHGRNHSSGGERGFPPTKVKQIYVAKQSTGGSSPAL